MGDLMKGELAATLLYRRDIEPSALGGQPRCETIRAVTVDYRPLTG